MCTHRHSIKVDVRIAIAIYFEFILVSPIQNPSSLCNSSSGVAALIRLSRLLLRDKTYLGKCSVVHHPWFDTLQRHTLAACNGSRPGTCMQIRCVFGPWTTYGLETWKSPGCMQFVHSSGLHDDHSNNTACVAKQ